MPAIPPPQKRGNLKRKVDGLSLVCSYCLFFGLGCCMVRETSTLMVSQYFKRRRDLVEMLASSGTGLGITLFSNAFHAGLK
jgi:hypothetical protein